MRRDKRHAGDIFRRTFIGDVAQCGCRWERRPGIGDVLVECPIHKAATTAAVAKTERTVLLDEERYRASWRHGFGRAT